MVLPATFGALSNAVSAQFDHGNRLSYSSQSDLLERIGVQLYTVRTLLADNYEGTIRAIADLGYDEVESVWDPMRNPEDIRALFNEVELLAPSTHAPIQALKNNLEQVLDAAQIMDHSYIVCPWLSEEQRSMEQYKNHVILFNEVGAACKEVGIQFAYHNHEFEFEADENGIIPYDFLLEETDPELVKMELDLYWVAYANQDPIEYFKRYPGRFPLSHVKDMGSDQQMTAVGEGEIDFATIFAESEIAGLKYYIVEHDHPEDPMASIQTSLQYLRSLEF